MALPNFLSLPAAASCGQVDTTDPSFCTKFKAIAVCHCSASLPAGMCQDMNTLYSRMIAMFRTQQRACEYQKDTTAQDCMDAWNCYRQGGRNSRGGLCSATGNACQ